MSIVYVSTNGVCYVWEGSLPYAPIHMCCLMAQAYTSLMLHIRLCWVTCLSVGEQTMHVFNGVSVGIATHVRHPLAFVYHFL